MREIRFVWLCFGLGQVKKIDCRRFCGVFSVLVSDVFDRADFFTTSTVPIYLDFSDQLTERDRDKTIVDFVRMFDEKTAPFERYHDACG